MKEMRRQIVLTAANAGQGHIASALSILDILWVLYDQVLRYDPKDPRSDDRDRLILSKGHAALALYVVLAAKGFFPVSELERFDAYDSILGGHPDPSKVPGVEAPSGSLGHGLSLGVGMAMGMRNRNVNRRVYVLVGDGECNEGSIWESVLLAAHHRLDNLVCIVDHNHSGDRALVLGDLAAKFRAFGWIAGTVNGHNQRQLYQAMKVPIGGHSRPTAIIAKTVKGYGCKRMENNPAWHYGAPTQDELPAILEELA